MKLATLLLLGLGPCFANGKKTHHHFIEQSSNGNEDSFNQTAQSIIGGDEIVKGSRPYLVSIGSDHRGHYCGGSLISPHAVMTSAACLFIARSMELLYWDPPQWVDIYRHDLNDDSGVIRIRLKHIGQCDKDGDIVYHPDYDFYEDERDVAILFLEDAVKDIIPVTLNPDPAIPSKNGDPFDVAGWGYTNASGPLSNTPRAVTVGYVSNEDCTRKPYRYPAEFIYDDMICAIEDGKGLWYGDGGDPLVLGKPVTQGGGPKYPVIQVGIGSWVWGVPADPRFPVVYTRVSSVVNFVKETVCERKDELCPDRGSKTSKTTKTSKPQNECAELPVYDPVAMFPTWSPTMTPMPTTSWPTWIPTWNPAVMPNMAPS